MDTYKYLSSNMLIRVLILKYTYKYMYLNFILL